MDVESADEQMHKMILVPRTTHKTQYCHRHRPDVQRPECENKKEVVMRENLKLVPQKDVDAIQLIWNLYAKLGAPSRQLALEGVIIQSCLSQLSFISQELDNMLRFDLCSIAPKEMALKIFSYLDAQSLCHAAQVNRSWRQLADDDVLWHRLCDQHIDRKCASCGWGLPLLDISKYRRRGNSFSSVYGISQEEDEQPISKRRKMDRKRSIRPWKEIYAERQAVERNWRAGIYVFKTIKEAHVGGVSAMHFSDAAGLVATAGVTDNVIKVWDASTHALVATLEGHTGAVRALQITDKNNVISGSDDGTIKFWNYRTGACVRTLEGHNGAVLSLHFDHNLLASGGTDHTIRFWDFATGTASSLLGHTDWVNCVRLHGRNQLFSCSDDHTIRRWDLVTKKCLHVYQGHHGSVESIRLSAVPHHLLHPNAPKDNRPVRMVSGGLDNLVLVWQVDRPCQKPLELFGHREGVWGVSFDTLRTFSCAQDGVVKVWDTDSGVLLHNLSPEGEEKPLLNVQSSDTKVYASGENGNVYEWSFDEVVDWSRRIEPSATG